MKVKMKGIKRLLANLETLRKVKGAKSYRAALTKVLLKAEAESMRRTPVDTGNLRSSAAGNARITSSGPKGASGVVYYTANYAVFVHERTELKHNVGEAKFLHNAMAKVLPFMEGTIGVSIKSDMFKRDM